MEDKVTSQLLTFQLSRLSCKAFSKASKAALVKPLEIASGEVSMAKHTEGTKGLRDDGCVEGTTSGSAKHANGNDSVCRC